MSVAPLILAFVTAQRIGELVLARRNTRRLIAHGGIEIAPGHYPAIVFCHVLWLASLWLFGASKPVEASWLILYGLLQALRCWVLVTLRSRWTTRIIVLPGKPLVRGGPYRFIRHPNYAVVVGEIACLPLVFGLWADALVFTLANAAIISIRIRAENHALESRSEIDADFT